MKKTPVWKALGLPRPRGLATLPKPGEKRRKPRDEREQRYQELVAEWMGWALPPEVLWFAVPNGGWRSKKTAGLLKAAGARAGVADLLLIYRGIVHGLELKVKGGEQSAAQIRFEHDLDRAGGHYATAWDTLEAVQLQLHEWGIPMRSAVPERRAPEMNEPARLSRRGGLKA